MPKEQRHHGPSAGAGQPGGGSRLLSPSASLRDPVSARRRLRPGGVTVWRAGGHGQGTPGAGEAQGTEAGRTARGWSGQDGLRGEGPCASGVGGRQNSGSIAERGRGQAGLREGGQEGSPGTQEVEMRPGDRKGLRVSYRGRRRWNGRAGEGVTAGAASRVRAGEAEASVAGDGRLASGAVGALRKITAEYQPDSTSSPHAGERVRTPCRREGLASPGPGAGSDGQPRSVDAGCQVLPGWVSAPRRCGHP